MESPEYSRRPSEPPGPQHDPLSPFSAADKALLERLLNDEVDRATQAVFESEREKCPQCAAKRRQEAQRYRAQVGDLRWKVLGL